MKNRFSKLIEKDGFYIILFICVCLVAITSVLVSKGNINKENKDKLSELEDLVIVEDEMNESSLQVTHMKDDAISIEDLEIAAAKSQSYEGAEETEETDETVEESEEVEEMEEIQEPEEEKEPLPINTGKDMLMPVEGKLGLGFTKDTLIYSETLEEWTSHNGIDIFAAEGTPVKACLSGKVTEVYEDSLWGIVIIIDHGNGLMTKYANLSTKDMVKEGGQVNKGDTISKLGKTATIEMLIDSHIHFEVIKDGVNVDPNEYLIIAKD